MNKVNKSFVALSWMLIVLFLGQNVAAITFNPDFIISDEEIASPLVSKPADLKLRGVFTQLENNKNINAITIGIFKLFILCKIC